MMQTAKDVKAELKALGKPRAVAKFKAFYRATPGGYGEGDDFFVVSVPEQRQIAKACRDLPRAEVLKLLRDPIHECRLTALFILVSRYERNIDRDQVVTDYLEHLDYVNNWDLVDSSAHKILGASLVGQRDQSILQELADSGHLWRERVSVVACWMLIKADDFRMLKKLCRQFLSHEHDLIHKATGWMLREMGKRDEDELIHFLNMHYSEMPRTMLRYSIEKFDRDTRKAYLRGEF